MKKSFWLLGLIILLIIPTIHGQIIEPITGNYSFNELNISWNPINNPIITNITINGTTNYTITKNETNYYSSNVWSDGACVSTYTFTNYTAYGGMINLTDNHTFDSINATFDCRAGGTSDKCVLRFMIIYFDGTIDYTINHTVNGGSALNAYNRSFPVPQNKKPISKLIPQKAGSNAVMCDDTEIKIINATNNGANITSNFELPIGTYNIILEQINTSETLITIGTPFMIISNNFINFTFLNSLNNLILSGQTINYEVIDNQGNIINGLTTTGNAQIQSSTGTGSITISGTDIVSKTTDYTSIYGTNYYNISTYPGQVVLLATRDMFTDALINNVSINLSGTATYNWLVNGTQNYTNITAGGYNVQIGKSGYTNFTDTFTVSRTDLVNKTYYLTTNGQNTIFYVKNIYDQFLEGAIVNISRSSDQALLYSKTTDGVGSVLFVLDPSITYLVTATLNGYNSYSGLITPSTNSFTLTLGTTQTSIPDYYTGIINTFSPIGNLQNNTNYNLTATYTSDDWNITNCYLQILYLNNTIINTTIFTTCDEDEGEGTITFNTGNNTYIQLISIYTINATNTSTNTSYSQNISYKKTYQITSYYEGDYSLAKAIRNTKNFNGSGFGNNEIMMITFILIFSVAITAMRRSVNKYVNSGTLLILITLLVLTASTFNLLPLTFLQYTNPLFGEEMAQYGLAILLALLTIYSVIMNKEEEK